jgi:16S rRNA G966 N2-methylase RsmD
MSIEQPGQEVELHSGRSSTDFEALYRAAQPAAVTDIKKTLRINLAHSLDILYATCKWNKQKHTQQKNSTASLRNISTNVSGGFSLPLKPRYMALGASGQ